MGDDLLPVNYMHADPIGFYNKIAPNQFSVKLRIYLDGQTFGNTGDRTRW